MSDTYFLRCETWARAMELLNMCALNSEFLNYSASELAASVLSFVIPKSYGSDCAIVNKWSTGYELHDCCLLIGRFESALRHVPISPPPKPYFVKKSIERYERHVHHPNALELTLKLNSQ
jgi:hypothetical protein